MRIKYYYDGWILKSRGILCTRKEADFPYCDNVKMKLYNLQNQYLFVLDTQADDENKDAKDYDWTNHHIKYDEEIVK